MSKTEDKDGSQAHPHGRPYTRAAPTLKTTVMILNTVSMRMFQASSNAPTPNLVQVCDVDNYHRNADESEKDDKEATLHHIVHYVVHHGSDAVVFREYAVHDGDVA